MMNKNEGLVFGAGGLVVTGYYSVLNVDDAVSIFGDVVFVGDEHNGIAFRLQAIEEGHDLNAGL